MNLREILNPDAYKLVSTETGSVKSVIVDQDLDPFNVLMGGDGCIEIETEKMGYILLSIQDLKELVRLIRKADKLALKNYRS